MPNNKHGLGRSFESLIPTDLLDESFDPTADQDQKVSELRQIRLDEIEADPNQPRKKFEEKELEALANSIKEHGVLQPIIVTSHKSGYQIVAGERRYHASKMAGLDKIPALVRTLSDQHHLELSLIENLQRQDLNVIEVATAYLKLRDQFNLTLDQIAHRVSAGSISAISNKLRLLKLPKFVIDLIIKGDLTEGQTRPLVGLDDDVVKKIVPRIIRESWSARRIEQFTVDLKKNREQAEMPIEKQIKEQPYKRQLQQFKKHLQADVAIHTTTKGSGRITIKFKNDEDFERLQKLLS